MCYISYNKTGGVSFCKTLFVLLMLFCEGRKNKQEKNVKNFNNKRCYKNAIDHKVAKIIVITLHTVKFQCDFPNFPSLLNWDLHCFWESFPDFQIS